MDPNEKRRLELAIMAARRSSDKLIAEIVEWLAAEVKRRGTLNHHEAAKAVRERSPYLKVIRGFISVDQERNDSDGSTREVYRFGPRVLKAFGGLTGKTVRWGKNDRYWVAVKPRQTRRA
jgi:hypothetical protein